MTHEIADTFITDTEQNWRQRTIVAPIPGGAIRLAYIVHVLQNAAKVTPRIASAGSPCNGFLMNAYMRKRST